MLYYHRIVQEGIDLFGERHLKKNALSKSKGGTSLYIHHPTNANHAPLVYKPDCIFTLEDRRKIVFQVLGSQANKKREIEADIIRAFLCPHISKLIFVVPTEAYYKRMIGISSIIQDTLIDYGTRKKTLPIVMTLLIPSSAKTPKMVADYLIKTEKRIFGTYA